MAFCASGAPLDRPTQSSRSRGDLLIRNGVWLATLAATASALPVLRLPFLSDDWTNLAAVSQRIPDRTPFGYVRPLYLASLKADLLLWGLSPWGFHLTNLALLAGSAALVVLLCRRYTGDPAVAGLAGLLFALHPYHIECAAWIAARADLLSGLLFLAAALFYDRWRSRLRGVPIGAMLAFTGALLAKEPAVVLPAFLLFVGFAIPARRPTLREWGCGYVPMLVLMSAYIVWMARAAPQIPRALLLGGVGLGWIKKLLYFGTAALVPVHVEVMESSPALWGALALVAGIALLTMSWAGSGRIPRTLWSAAAAFVILLGVAGPFSFQERYLFLPTVASAIALTSLLLTSGPRPRAAALLLLLPLWLLAAAWHWKAWNDAAKVSNRLMEDLVRTSLRPEVEEILVVNMPQRVHGVPVAADFAAAVRLSGGRAVRVRKVLYVDYPAPSAESVDAGVIPAIRRDPSFAEVSLRIPSQVFSRFAIVPTGKPGERLEAQQPTVSQEEPGRLRVRIPRVAGRAALVWHGGRLEPLF